MRAPTLPRYTRSPSETSKLFHFHQSRARADARKRRWQGRRTAQMPLCFSRRRGRVCLLFRGALEKEVLPDSPTLPTETGEEHRPVPSTAQVRTLERSSFKLNRSAALCSPFPAGGSFGGRRRFSVRPDRRRRGRRFSTCSHCGSAFVFAGVVWRFAARGEGGPGRRRAREAHVNFRFDAQVRWKRP